MCLLDHYDALLLDLDGTIWEGGRPIEHAVEAINHAGVATKYITNNASRSPEKVADMLRAIDLNASAEDVVTSAQAAVKLALKEHKPGSTVLVLGSDSFKQLAREAGYTVTDTADDHPSVVLHGHNPETGWAQLTEAAMSIHAGAAYIASNVDSTLPIQRGLAVGNGSMVEAVVSATGVRPASAGKPEPTMFLQAVDELGAKAPLAVGDRLNTDIAGGNAAGIPTLQVLTGVSGALELLEAPKELRPTFIAADMRDLFSSREELIPGPQGGFTARVDKNDILLERGDSAADPVQALRTVLQVAWSMPNPPRYVRPMSDKAEEATATWR